LIDWMMGTDISGSWSRGWFDLIMTFAVLPYSVVLLLRTIPKVRNWWNGSSQADPPPPTASWNDRLNYTFSIRTSLLGILGAPFVWLTFFFLELGKWTRLRLVGPMLVCFTISFIFGTLVVVVALFNRPKKLVPPCARGTKGLLH